MKAPAKMLPYSEDAEQAVLGSILGDGQAVYTALSILGPADFSSKKHGEIFQAMAKLATTETPVDVLSVADELRRGNKFDKVGGIDFLSDLEGLVPTAQAVSHFCRIVNEKAQLRQLAAIGEWLNQEAFAEFDDAAGLIETAQNKMYGVALDLQNKSHGAQVYGPEAIAQMAVDQAAAWMEDPEGARGIETGFVRLDSIIRGLKDVNIISASTGIGKTAFALNLGVQVGIYQKIPMLYVNCEMNFEELTIRLQGILAGIPSEVILRGRYSKRHPWEKVTAASEKIRDGYLHLTDNHPKTINAVVALIQKHKAQHGIKVVILDYLGEIEVTKEELRESEFIVYGQWVQRLKGVCTRLGIKLILLAQLNREGDREVSKNKIAGSWKIAQMADVFMILGVDQKGKHFLKVDKNRNGPAPVTIDLMFDKETQRIVESE